MRKISRPTAIGGSLAVLVCLGLSVPAHAETPGSTAATAGSRTQTFGYTSGPQYFTVPPGTAQLTITADGASGGNGQDGDDSTGGVGGLGGQVVETVPVYPGELLQLDVGGTGQPAGIPYGAGVGGSAAGGTANGGTGGYGNGTDQASGGSGGGGGAATEIDELSNPVTGTPTVVLAVAGGGGGGGGTGSILGYDGGPGGPGANPAVGGTGGTGLGAGSGGSGGTSGNTYGDNGGSAGFATSGGGGGGGGGGYNPAGGGAGGGGYAGGIGEGGGGGAGGGLSYAELTSATYGQAPSSGNGSVTLSWYPDQTTSTLSTSANPIDSGQAVTITDTVVAGNPAGPAPTGTVGFSDFNATDDQLLTLGTATLTPVNAGTSVARLTTTTLPQGSNGLSGFYNGDSTYPGGETPTQTEQVNPPAGARVSPTSIAFGSRSVGSSTTRTVTVTSTGRSSLDITRVRLVGSGFALRSDGCLAKSLPTGRSCTISVAFRPHYAEAYSAHLYVSDNAPGGTQRVTLSGRG